MHRLIEVSILNFDEGSPSYPTQNLIKQLNFKDLHMIMSELKYVGDVTQRVAQANDQ